MKFQSRFVVTGILLGLALGFVPPYPHSRDGIIFLASCSFYFFISLIAENPRFRRFWFWFGCITFLSMFTSMFWFNHLTMSHGVWFPPDYIPIIQQFYRVDGEASYEAHISNLFFILWATSTVVLAVGHLTSAGNRTPQKLLRARGS